MHRDAIIRAVNFELPYSEPFFFKSLDKILEILYVGLTAHGGAILKEKRLRLDLSDCSQNMRPKITRIAPALVLSGYTKGSTWRTSTDNVDTLIGTKVKGCDVRVNYIGKIIALQCV